MIFYSGEPGEDNCEATLATGTSLRNNVHQYMVAQGAQTHPKKENADKGSRDNNSAIKPGLTTVETYRFRYFF